LGSKTAVATETTMLDISMVSRIKRATVGFADTAAAEAWAEADRVTHRPGPKRKDAN
jgi:hypothetical protein